MKVYRKGKLWIKIVNIQESSYDYIWSISPGKTHSGTGLDGLLKGLKHNNFKLDEAFNVKSILEKYGVII